MYTFEAISYLYSKYCVQEHRKEFNSTDNFPKSWISLRIAEGIVQQQKLRFENGILYKKETTSRSQMIVKTGERKTFHCKLWNFLLDIAAPWRALCSLAHWLPAKQMLETQFFCTNEDSRTPLATRQTDQYLFNAEVPCKKFININPCRLISSCFMNTQTSLTFSQTLCAQCDFWEFLQKVTSSCTLDQIQELAPKFQIFAISSCHLFQWHFSIQLV